MNTFRCGLLLLLMALFSKLGWAEPPIDPALESEVSALSQAIGSQRLVLLGEKHGTRETPRFAAALVEALAAEQPVILGLEMARGETAAVRRFLRSDGSAQARADLLAGPWWKVKGTQHDGRRNLDVVDMLDHLRRLRAAGRDIEVLPFDLDAGVKHDHHSRDREMAAYIREQFLAKPQHRFLALTGNVHAMRQKPERAPTEMQQPMGSYLIDLEPFSVDINANSGEFWGCGPRCAPVPVYNSVMKSGPSDHQVYDYAVFLPRFSVARFLP